MKVLLINRSDSLGGAAVASRRLMNALVGQGIDARMLVVDRRTDDKRVTAVGSKMTNKYNFMAERLGIFARNGMNRSTLFMIDNASHGLDLSRNPMVRDADVIVLNWINQGMMSLKDIERLCNTGKPVVWTMHDMWNCTGVCHHAGECRRYESECRECPLTGKHGKDLSTGVQQAKAKLYSSCGIHFVAVSNWLEQCCRHSSLMRDCDISVIGNPFPTADFQCDHQSGFGPDTRVIAMGAARLDDPIKGFDLLIDTTRYIANEMPDLASRLHLLLYGNLRDESLLGQIGIPYTHLGYINDVRDVYRQADIVLSTSRCESFGYTLLEGMASGCVPVTTGTGGQPDIVKHLVNGYVTADRTTAQMARGIEWAVGNAPARETQHQWVLDNFNASIVAAKYIELFNRITNKK